jgi:hypothetical protein
MERSFKKEVQALKLGDEGRALFQQGNDFGDIAALRTSIERFKSLVEMTPRETALHDWINMQNDLGRCAARDREVLRGLLQFIPAIECKDASYQGSASQTADSVNPGWRGDAEESHHRPDCQAIHCASARNRNGVFEERLIKGHRPIGPYRDPAMC